MTARGDRARHLDAFRSAIAPPADRRARNLEGLRRRLADDGVVHSLGDREGSPRSIVPTAIAASVAIAAAALLLLWGGATSVRALRDAARTPVHEAPATSVRAPIDRTAGVPQRATLEDDARSTLEATRPAVAPRGAAPTEPSAPAARRPAGISRAAAPSPADRLREELALVRRARAALQRDDFPEVWRLTQAHATEYPQGALAHERDAWRSLSACRLARSDAATIFAAFLEDHDGSPYAARVRGACEAP